MKVEWWETERVTPYPGNPRKNGPAVAGVKASIERFGWRQPIVVDGDGVVVVGHTRLLAAKDMGLDRVPVHVATDLSPGQVRSYRIADNRTHEDSAWDERLLLEELTALRGSGIDLAETGFTGRELDRMLASELRPDSGEAVCDPPAEPKSRAGCVYDLGPHRLACGDATDSKVWDDLLADTTATLCCTSPPYNIGALEIPGQRETERKYREGDDTLGASDYLAFLSSVMAECLARCEITMFNIQILAGNRTPVIDLLHEWRDHFKDVLYWVKDSGAPHIQAGVVNSRAELILCFDAAQNPTRVFGHAQFEQGTFWNVVEGPGARGNEFASVHKATFPPYLPEWAIKGFTPRGSVVVDCFGGTGTTLIVAEQLGRVARIIELDPGYCDVVRRRYAEFTKPA